MSGEEIKFAVALFTFWYVVIRPLFSYLAESKYK
jgi:hypothetical protein